MLFFFGWSLEMPLLPKKGCVYGGLLCHGLCLFCHVRQQSRAYLFFNCSFSRRIWRALMADCLVADPPVDWELVGVLLFCKGRVSNPAYASFVLVQQFITFDIKETLCCMVKLPKRRKQL
jgi:hypothetical protein